MIHRSRIFQLKRCENLNQLVANLAPGRYWTLCTAWGWNGLLLLNDSFREDGAQEYAVVRESDRAQVESLTVSWMRPAKLKALLERIAAGETEDFSYAYGYARNAVQDPDEHGRCPLCA